MALKVRRVRPSGTQIDEIVSRLLLGEGFGLNQDSDGLVRLMGGAWVEVRAEGVAFDGTDQATEINDIITHLNDLGGGVLLHRYGTLWASTIQLKSNVALIGSGWDSVIKQIASTSGHLIELASTSTEWAILRNLTLDGNKANQATANDGIHIANSGGSFTDGDSLHRISNVRIADVKGRGLYIDSGAREAVVDGVYTQRCDLNGFDLECTDSVFVGCTSGAAGEEGWLVSAVNSRLIGCKAFGSGQSDANKGDGFRVDQVRMLLSACEAQDNHQHGYHLVSAEKCELTGCIADSNGQTSGHGFRLNASTECRVSGLAFDRDPTPTQSYGVDMSNTSSDCFVDLFCYDNATGTVTGDEAGNTVIINGVMRTGPDFTRAAVIESEYGTDGSSDDEHFRAGKVGGGTAGNPYYTWKTSADAVPIGSIQGYDGTTAKTFIRFDFSGDQVILGDSAGGIGVDIDGLIGSLTVESLSVEDSQNGGDVNARIYNTYNAASSTDETASLDFGFADSGGSFAEAASLRAIKRADFNGAGDEDAALDVYVTHDDTPRFIARFIADTGDKPHLLIGTTTDNIGNDIGLSVNDKILLFGAGTTEVKGLVKSLYGTDGSTTNEHFRFGKTNAGASGNPYYAWKTDNSGQAHALLVGYDGTTTVTFIECDFDTRELILGESGGPPYGDVRVRAAGFQPYSDGGTQVGDSSKRWATSYWGGRVDIQNGTDGSTSDEHVRFGKDGSGAAGNPYYALKTTADATPHGEITGYNGSTTYVFLRLDYGNGRLEIPVPLLFGGIPTSNPGGSGLVWNDSGTLKIT